MPEFRKPYLRDGVPSLTMAQQEAALTAAGIDLSRAYRDVLTKAARRRRKPADLKEREKLLAPTSRRDAGEVIVVAGLRVLGWSIEDICDVMAAAGRRNSSIEAVDIGKRFDLTTSNAELAQAIGDTARARRLAGSHDGRSAGVAASAFKRNKRKEALLAEAKRLWALPPGEMSQPEIAAKIGVTVRTLNTWCGPRTAARQKAKEKLEGKML